MKNKQKHTHHQSVQNTLSLYSNLCERFKTFPHHDFQTNQKSKAVENYTAVPGRPSDRLFMTRRSRVALETLVVSNSLVDWMKLAFTRTSDGCHKAPLKGGPCLIAEGHDDY